MEIRALFVIFHLGQNMQMCRQYKFILKLTGPKSVFCTALQYQCGKKLDFGRQKHFLELFWVQKSQFLGKKGNKSTCSSPILQNEPILINLVLLKHGGIK